jgi:hypothetical protein
MLTALRISRRFPGGIDGGDPRRIPQHAPDYLETCATFHRAGPRMR